MGRSVDHRGKPVRLALPSELKEAGINTDLLDIPLVGGKPGGRWWLPSLHWTALLFFAFTIGVLFVLFSISLRLGAPAWSLVIIALVARPRIVLTPITRWWWNGIGDKFVDRILHTGHCTACGFSLEDLLKEEDGCVVCPECGAAWKGCKLKPQWLRET